MSDNRPADDVWQRPPRRAPAKVTPGPKPAPPAPPRHEPVIEGPSAPTPNWRPPPVEPELPCADPHDEAIRLYRTGLSRSTIAKRTGLPFDEVCALVNPDWRRPEPKVVAPDDSVGTPRGVSLEDAREVFPPDA